MTPLLGSALLLGVGSLAAALKGYTALAFVSAISAIVCAILN